MRRMSKVNLDSPSWTLRTVERWKRGLVALIMIGGLTLGAAVVCGIVALVLEVLGADRWQVIVIALTAATILPWLVGDRKVLQNLGGLAKLSDE
jgi:hypothetical protein